MPLPSPKNLAKAAASAAMLAWVLLGPGLLAMLGCSSTTTISGDGTTVEVPADISQAGFTVTCYDQFLGAWAAGTKQREISEAWDEAGAKFDDGIAVLDGCYLVACARKFGAVGDKVTFRMSDGTELPCIIADQKSEGDANYSEYGHMYAGKVNVIEFEVAYSFYKQYGNPGTNGWRMEWAGLSVSSAINHGGNAQVSTGLSGCSATSSAFGTGYVQRAREIAEDDSRGYTFGAKGQNGEYDCSGLVWCALRDSGYDVSSWPGGTSTEEKGLLAMGFDVEDYSADRLRAGDILWWDSGDAGHTAIYSGDGKLIEAAQDYDGQPGDSGGREIWEHGLYDPGWQRMAHAPASSSGSAAGLYGCAAKAEGLAGGQEYDAANDRQKKVADLAASRAVDSTEYQQYCAKWAGDVVDSALGASTSRYGSAYLDFKANAVSTSPTGIPVGAAVYGSGWPTASDGSSNPFGHVGIYIGDGKVADYTKVWQIDDWISAQRADCNGQVGWLGWGWIGGIALDG